MLSNYIFDLDGTLIDSSERMYKLFCDLVPECELTKDEYWELKRDKINHKMILEKLYPARSFDVFNDCWMPKIEMERYLAMDKNYPDTIKVLSQLKENGHNIFLLTARQSKKGLLDELKRLGLLIFFDKVLITEGKQSKERILLTYSKENKSILDKSSYFISDMGKDIQLGRKYRYKTIGISHGFMSREKLEEYHPDLVIDDLSELCCEPLNQFRTPTSVV